MTHRIAFVTGAGGFIGRHLVRTLLSRYVQVTALMFPGEVVPDEWGDEVKLVEGDIRNLNTLAETIGQFDVVFHLAAVVSDWGGLQEHIDITVTGTVHAIELTLKNNAHFIVTTSVCAYADALGKGSLTEDSPTGKATSNYEICKQEQERVTLEAVNQRRLKATIVRPGNVFGVGSHPWVNIPLQLIREGKPIIMGKGDWDAGLVHVDNVVHLMWLIANSNLTNGDIFLGSDGFGITWQHYWTQLAKVAGAPKPKAIPNILARVLAPVLEGFASLIKQKQRPLITRQAFRLTGGENKFSTKKSEELLLYKPQVSFEEAMSELELHFNSKVGKTL